MRFLKKIVAVLFVGALSISLCLSGYAAQGNVSYVGGAEKFIFTPGSEYSPSDLFADFKNVMPGDTITQQIIISNNVLNRTNIKLYIRSLGSGPESENFLSQMMLTVKNHSDILFEAPPNQTARLTEWVYLGILSPGDNTTLDLQLNVPVTLDNEFQKAVGYLDWEFKVEEIPYDPDDPVPPDPKPVPDPKPTPTEPTRPAPADAVVPRTGDLSNLLLWIVLMAASAGMIVLLIVIPRKRDR